MGKILGEFFKRYGGEMERSNPYYVCESIGYLKAIRDIYPMYADEINELIDERFSLLFKLEFPKGIVSLMEI